MSDAVTSPPPDPAEAHSAEELIDLLKRLRTWAGQPSLRRLRHLAGRSASPDGHQVDALPASTVSYILNGRGLPGLPRLAFVEAYVAACLSACDLSPEEIEAQIARWQDAWRRIASPGDLEPATRQAEETTPSVHASGSVSEPMPPDPMPTRPSRGRVLPAGLAGLVAGALIATVVTLLLRPANDEIPLVRGEDPNRCDAPSVCFYDHGQTGRFRDVTDDYQSLNDSRDTVAMVNPRKDDVVWLRWEDGHSECTMPFATYRLAPGVADIRISRDYRCPSNGKGERRAVLDPAAVVPAPLPPCYVTTSQGQATVGASTTSTSPTGRSRTAV
ncbi:helix-turn-helix transcriptional regulator [Microbispora sp. NPDC088329]|uniref:helix-turn-helix transcriptional regulator n=1 Tax=Microbispora sp. NPDC088329 TaxID=3154869 RepID=UPI003427412C